MKTYKELQENISLLKNKRTKYLAFDWYDLGVKDKYDSDLKLKIITSRSGNEISQYIYGGQESGSTGSGHYRKTIFNDKIIDNIQDNTVKEYHNKFIENKQEINKIISDAKDFYKNK